MSPAFLPAWPTSSYTWLYVSSANSIPTLEACMLAVLARPSSVSPLACPGPKSLSPLSRETREEVEEGKDIQKE